MNSAIGYDPLIQNEKDRIKVLKRNLKNVLNTEPKELFFVQSQSGIMKAKNTKYFLSLEKRYFKQGTISQLKLNDNILVTSDKDISSECKTFYEDSHASKIQTRLMSCSFFAVPFFLLPFFLLQFLAFYQASFE